MNFRWTGAPQGAGIPATRRRSSVAAQAQARSAQVSGVWT